METQEKMENQENQKISPAERMYQNHLKNVRKYQRKNPEKIKEKCKKYIEKMKEERPDEYTEMLLKKRDYYANVRKPRIQHLRELKRIEDEIKKKNQEKIDSPIF
jgi:hypothetical protein